MVEQLLKLVAAAVDVADDVERAGLILAVGPQRRALDANGVNRLRRAQDRHLAEALALQPAQTLAQASRTWLRTTCGAKLAVGARGVALQAGLLVHIEHDGDGEDVMLAGDAHERRAVLRLDAGGVNHGQPPKPETQPGDMMQPRRRPPPRRSGRWRRR